MDLSERKVRIIEAATAFADVIRSDPPFSERVKARAAFVAELDEALAPLSGVVSPQRQDSLDDQLRDVRAAAVRMGCYDAADWIKARTLYES